MIWGITKFCSLGAAAMNVTWRRSWTFFCQLMKGKKKNWHGWVLTSVIDDLGAQDGRHLQHSDEGLVHGSEGERGHAVSPGHLGNVHSAVTWNEQVWHHFWSVTRLRKQLKSFGNLQVHLNAWQDCRIGMGFRHLIQKRNSCCIIYSIYSVYREDFNDTTKKFLFSNCRK